MNKCSSCKHWKNIFETINKIPDTAKCEKLSYVTYPVEGVTAVSGNDCEDDILDDYLDTGKDFGCIHHESK